MPGMQSTRADIEVGGMQWEVTPPEQLRQGRLLEMVSLEDFGSTQGYPVTDRTTVIKTDDGEMHLSVESERNDSSYKNTLTFEASTLRAIVEHVEAIGSVIEQPSSAGDRNIFSRIMARLSSHAS